MMAFCDLAKFPISVFLLGALTSSIFYDLMLSRSRRFIPLQSLFSFLRWNTLLQLLCQTWSYCFESPNYSDASSISVSVLLELMVISTFSFMISSTTIDKSRALRIGIWWELRVKAELSMERELSPEELVEIDLHEIRKQLKKVGLQTLKSLMFFTSASYGIASLACLYQLHEPSLALLDILLSISNYGHGRYCHAMIYRILDEVEEKSRFEATIRSKSQENNKLKFMQFVLHEVRVPLNSIVLGLDLLGIEEGLTEDIQDTVDMMKQSASFMVATLNDVLSWQKVEQGVVELDLAPLSPDRLVQSVLASFRVAIEQKTMQIVVGIDKDIPKCVRGDFHRLQHVLANLMSNAIKFSPESSTVEVHVSQIHHGNSSKKMLRFSVKDEGIGINLEDQQRLFSPYMQIRPQDTQGGKGTGLGLSICKGIVKAHHGEIGCLSKDSPDFHHDKGSEFFFMVPLDEIDECLCQEDAPIKSLGLSHLVEKVSHRDKSRVETSDMMVQVEPDELEECPWPYKWWLKQNKENDVNTNHSTSSKYLSCDSCESASTLSLDTFPSVSGPPSAMTTSSFAFSGGANSSRSSFYASGDQQNSVLIAPINVLICDDVITNRKMLERVVGKKTLQCDCCCDGTEALSAVCAKGVEFYDLIFMDNIMPVMCGLEATKLLRERGYRKLIVGVTGSAMDTETNAFADCGADVVLAKPVHMETLHRLLKNCNTLGTTSPLFIDDNVQRDLQRQALDSLLLT